MPAKRTHGELVVLRAGSLEPAVAAPSETTICLILGSGGSGKKPPLVREVRLFTLEPGREHESLADLVVLLRAHARKPGDLVLTCGGRRRDLPALRRAFLRFGVIAPGLDFLFLPLSTTVPPDSFATHLDLEDQLSETPSPSSLLSQHAPGRDLGTSDADDPVIQTVSTYLLYLRMLAVRTDLNATGLRNAAAELWAVVDRLNPRETAIRSWLQLEIGSASFRRLRGASPR
jgi:hypothetical protein